MFILLIFMLFKTTVLTNTSLSAILLHVLTDYIVAANIASTYLTT